MSELERWEARFSEPGYLFGTEPNAFLKGNRTHTVGHRVRIRLPEHARRR